MSLLYIDFNTLDLLGHTNLFICSTDFFLALELSVAAKKKKSDKEVFNFFFF